MSEFKGNMGSWLLSFALLVSVRLYVALGAGKYACLPREWASGGN
jgi:hypothetical protein